jgi:hypothetical protein
MNEAYWRSWDSLGVLVGFGMALGDEEWYFILARRTRKIFSEG